MNYLSPPRRLSQQREEVKAGRFDSYPMNIIIIGSEGFIGKHIYQYFSKNEGYRCYCADIKPIKVHEKDIDIVFAQLDRENPDYKSLIKQAIATFGTINVCINASGSADVSASLRDPITDSIQNFTNVEKILEAIRINDSAIRFITLSSAAVYGNPASLPVEENSVLQPISPYGYHKLCSEKICDMYYKLYVVKTYVKD